MTDHAVRPHNLHAPKFLQGLLPIDGASFQIVFTHFAYFSRVGKSADTRAANTRHQAAASCAVSAESRAVFWRPRHAQRCAHKRRDIYDRRERPSLKQTASAKDRGELLTPYGKSRAKIAKPSATSQCQRLCLVPIRAVFREGTTGSSNDPRSSKRYGAFLGR